MKSAESVKKQFITSFSNTNDNFLLILEIAANSLWSIDGFKI